jgi:hypothetical protein
VVDPDSDDDGMSDEYELVHGLDPFDHRDASDDLDGDGETNLREQLAGTDPALASSVFRITDVLFDQDNVVLVFPTALGKSYHVQRSDLFPAHAWVTVASNLPGTGFLQSVLDPVNDSPTRFYRLMLVPEP